MIFPLEGLVLGPKRVKVSSRVAGLNNGPLLGGTYWLGTNVECGTSGFYSLASRDTGEHFFIRNTKSEMASLSSRHSQHYLLSNKVRAND